MNVIDPTAGFGTLGAPPPIPSGPAPNDFRGMLDRAVAADDEGEAREAATAFVATTFVLPILASLREGSQAVPPFAPGTAEQRFGPLLDRELADRIVGASGFQIVDSVLTRLGLDTSQDATPGAPSP